MFRSHAVQIDFAPGSGRPVRRADVSRPAGPAL